MRYISGLAIAVLAFAICVAAVGPPDVRFQPIPLDFILHNSASPEKHQIETMVGGVAAFDFDNDGLIDLYFANGAAQPSLTKSDAS